MPKRFDKAIKVLTAEKHRIIGKFASELAELGHDARMAVRAHEAKHINRAIEILKDHPENKYI